MSARLLRVEPGPSTAPGEPCSMASLVEAGRDGRLGEREEASLARHIAGCGPCRALARDLDDVRTLLRRPAGAPISPLDHQRGRLSLLRAASVPPAPDAPEATTSPSPIGARPGRARLRRGATLAAAVVALGAVAFAALAVPWRPPAPAPVAAITTGPQAAPNPELAEPVLITTAPQVVPNPEPVEPAPTTKAPEPQATRPRAAPPKPTRVARAAAAGRAKSAPPPPAPVEPSPMDEGGASRSFARAIDLIARGDYAAAGTELQTFRVAHPGDDRADLAAFLTIVSLQRAGRRGEAQEAARRYLELYPEGDRRADVVRVANER